MMTVRRSPRLAASLLAITALATLGACGGDGGPDVELSAEAEEGLELTRTNGCASCHGSDGEGGVGPAYVGLYGSEVQLEDGSTVVADEAYLTESITDPSAKRVEGYGLQMPSNDLSDAEVESVVTYIRELADAEEPEDS